MKAICGTRARPRYAERACVGAVLKNCQAVLFVVSLVVESAFALDFARQSTGAEAAHSKYGVTGKHVIVAILDRGIEYQHPDFRNPDGSTRIKAMLDMSGQNNWCNANNPAPVEYTEAQINAALQGGTIIAERDAVGHGTLTAGIAAGNGHVSNGKYAGIAPEADLIIVKMTSEGAPAHGDQPGEAPFVACVTQALTWIDEKITALGEPAVGLINSGTQLWGPVDGTSATSRAIDQVFGQRRPGRVYVEASGDEGGIPNHAGGSYSISTDTFVGMLKSTDDAQQMGLWYTGLAAQVSITMGQATVGPVVPGNSAQSADGTLHLIQYNPGGEFYPATSTSGDHFVWLGISGHGGESGKITMRALSTAGGHFDVYSCFFGAISFTDHLVPGRLTDFASTRSAIVTGAHVNRGEYIDIDGIPRTVTSGGAPGQLWSASSGGPTRDGRRGIDLTTPDNNIFAPIARNSYWATYRFNQPSDGAGYYSRQGATSGASPITVGASALLLQMKPDLTSDQVRALLDGAAVSDSNTGSTPNNAWGFGKISIIGAIDSLCVQYQAADATLLAKCRGSAAPPFGVIDTPISGSTGQAGAINFTGWALSPSTISKAALCREPVGESAAVTDRHCLLSSSPSGLVYLGDAVLVPGVRPDVAVTFPGYPNNNWGWGAQILTNYLPGTNGQPLAGC